MASTYTTRLRLEKQGTGENANTWGDKTNDTFDLIDKLFMVMLLKVLQDLPTLP